MPAPDATDARRLALEAQAALFRLLQETSSEAGKQILRERIARLSEILEEISFTEGRLLAEELNGLSDQLIAANAAVKADPFGPAIREIQALLQRIGDAVGAVAQETKGGIAEPPPAAPPPAAAVALSAGAPPATAPAAPAPGQGGLLRNDYAALFQSCKIRPERADLVRRTANRLLANAPRYQAVSDTLGGTIPWFVIGIIHSLESSFSFTRHLHNGDPLGQRTVNEPRGRPGTGSPPFTWEESAADALSVTKKLDRVPAWPLEVMLDRLERYNGAGYANMGMTSPYLWSFSQHWTKGKFVEDHKFDPEAPSSQCGAGVLLRHLVDTGAITLAAGGATSAGIALGLQSAALVAAAQTTVKSAQAELAFPGDVVTGSKNKAAVKRVQEWCTFHDCATPVDEGFGDGTRRAVLLFQQQAGIPATGIVDARTWAALTKPMHAALAPLAAVPESLNEAVVAVGLQHVAQEPVELGGENRGAWVRLYMDGKDGEPQQWCAGFLCFIIAQAAAALGLPMPITRRVGVQDLINDAKKAKRFIDGSLVTTPQARLARLKSGCIFVIKDGTTSHAGLVAQVGGDSFTSIEGNSDEGGSGLGVRAVSKSRGYPGKHFILLA